MGRVGRPGVHVRLVEILSDDALAVPVVHLVQRLVREIPRGDGSRAGREDAASVGFVSGADGEPVLRSLPEPLGEDAVPDPLLPLGRPKLHPDIPTERPPLRGVVVGDDARRLGAHLAVGIVQGQEGVHRGEDVPGISGELLEGRGNVHAVQGVGHGGLAVLRQEVVAGEGEVGVGQEPVVVGGVGHLAGGHAVELLVGAEVREAGAEGDGGHFDDPAAAVGESDDADLRGVAAHHVLLDLGGPKLQGVGLHLGCPASGLRGLLEVGEALPAEAGAAPGPATDDDDVAHREAPVAIGPVGTGQRPLTDVELLERLIADVLVGGTGRGVVGDGLDVVEVVHRVGAQAEAAVVPGAHLVVQLVGRVVEDAVDLVGTPVLAAHGLRGLQQVDRDLLGLGGGAASSRPVQTHRATDVEAAVGGPLVGVARPSIVTDLCQPDVAGRTGEEAVRHQHGAHTVEVRGGDIHLHLVALGLVVEVRLHRLLAGSSTPGSPRGVAALGLGLAVGEGRLPLVVHLLGELRHHRHVVGRALGSHGGGDGVDAILHQRQTVAEVRAGLRGEHEGRDLRCADRRSRQKLKLTVGTVVGAGALPEPIGVGGHVGIS